MTGLLCSRSTMQDTMRNLILTLTLAALTAPAALAQSNMSGHGMTMGGRCRSCWAVPDWR